MIDVYGTLGPSCASRAVLARMLRAGMTGIRLNLSHVTLRESRTLLEELSAAALETGTKPLLLVDLQGPELRVGRLDASLGLAEGDGVLLDGRGDLRDQKNRDGGGIARIPVPAEVCAALKEGMRVLLDDGRILLCVSRVLDGEAAEAKVLRGGILSGRKSIKAEGARIRLPALTGADLQNLRDAAAFGVTGVMQPFVRSRSDLEEVRRAIKESGAGPLQLVAKIENREGLHRLPELLPACDAVCIARGDLGNDMELWELPAVQKQIAAACRDAGKYFMVATQMLSSMEARAVPTRAEVNDIFNTVADGASGVMVTGETAVGKYPVEAIRYLANTAREAERFRTAGRR